MIVLFAQNRCLLFRHILQQMAQIDDPHAILQFNMEKEMSGEKKRSTFVAFEEDI